MLLLSLFAFVWSTPLSFPIFLLFLSFFIYPLMSISQPLSQGLLMIDDVSLLMRFMTLIVILISYLWVSYSKEVFYSLFFITLFCILVFSSYNIFILYFSYEASLIPILYIILKWGSYPERSVSSIILLLYTAIFSIPFVYFLFSVFSSHGSFDLSLLILMLVSTFDTNLLLVAVLFFTFSVKLPIYGLHFWLPMAHVEAPTFGSIILAGVLLKLGGLGLIRFSPFLVYSSILSYVTSYLFIRLILTGLICSFQSDFKRLIAYSSVNHMIAVPLIVLRDNSLTLLSSLFLMLFHGLSSPALFMLVGLTYQLYSTRQLTLMRGLLLVRPLLSFTIFSSFLFTLRAPPFPSFVSEVLFFAVSSDLTCFSFLFFLVFAFFSLVYNVNWFSSVVFGPSSTYNSSFHTTFVQFFTLFFIIFIAFFFMSLFILL